MLNDYLGDVGGAERYVTEVCRALSQSSMEVHVAFGRRTGELDISLPLHELPMALFEFPWFRRVSMRPLADLVHRLRPNVVYLNNVLNPYSLDVLPTDSKTFRFVHDHRLFCAEGKILWRSQKACERPFGMGCLWKTCLERCMGKNPLWWTAQLWLKPQEIRKSKSLRGLVVASRYMKEELCKQGFDSNRIMVHPLFSRFPATRKTRESEDLILYVGQLSLRKGVPLLLRHFEHMPSTCRLELVGQAPTLEEKRRVDQALLACQARDRVQLSGWIQGEALRDIYRRAMVLVMPSLWPEPFGLAGVEALSQGTPVVAFASGGIPEWLQDSAGGIVVPPGDWTGLVEAVNRICEDKKLRQDLGNAGRLYVETSLTLERHVEGLIQLFESTGG